MARKHRVAARRYQGNDMSMGFFKGLFLVLVAMVIPACLLSLAFIKALSIRAAQPLVVTPYKGAENLLKRTAERKFPSESLDYWRSFHGVTSSPESRCLTVRTDKGRLGNKLFEYASMYGTAKRYGFIPVLKTEELLFRFILRDNLQVALIPAKTWNQMKWRNWTEALASTYDEAALTSGLQGSANICMGTFLQSFRYFRGYEAEIVQQLTFSLATRTWAEHRLREALRKFPSDVQFGDISIVGVHARRGDYVGRYRELGYNTPPGDYYARATRYFVTRYNYVLFIVCSDGIDWTRGVLEKVAIDTAYSNARFEYVRGSDAQSQNDMVLLSLANHTIGSAGSFTFWAAMLRQYRFGKDDNGTTIYYAYPFVNGSKIAETYSYRHTDFYPPEWMSMV